MTPPLSLKFPVWDVPLPPAPPMTPEQYDRFLEETLRPDGDKNRLEDLPVPAKFVLVKEDGPLKNESSGTNR